MCYRRDHSCHSQIEDQNASAEASSRHFGWQTCQPIAAPLSVGSLAGSPIAVRVGVMSKMMFIESGGSATPTVMHI